MNKAKIAVLALVMFASMTVFPLVSVQAHDLSGWIDAYNPRDANDETSFGFSKGRHMDGDTLYYRWADQYTKNLLAGALADGVSMWDGMITAYETADPSTAHITITYDGDINAAYPAATVRYGPADNHIRTGYGDAEIVVHYNPANSTDTTRMQMMGHELGHLWDIDDLYTYDITNLDSIYSQLYVHDEATRHDMNAMYITLDNPWFLDENNNWRHYLSPGAWIQNDWLEVNGLWYYFGSGYDMVTGWQDIKGFSFYLDPSNESGAAVLGWRMIDDEWYFFRPATDYPSGGPLGSMATGWQWIYGDWYFFNPDGRMQIDWRLIDDEWYYFDAKGQIPYGWQWIADYWYYFDADGHFLTGWQYDSYGLSYYFDSDGQMLLGWQEIDDYWYYFDIADESDDLLDAIPTKT